MDQDFDRVDKQNNQHTDDEEMEAYIDENEAVETKMINLNIYNASIDEYTEISKEILKTRTKQMDFQIFDATTSFNNPSSIEHQVGTLIQILYKNHNYSEYLTRLESNLRNTKHVITEINNDIKAHNMEVEEYNQEMKALLMSSRTTLRALHILFNKKFLYTIDHVITNTHAINPYELHRECDECFAPGSDCTNNIVLNALITVHNMVLMFKREHHNTENMILSAINVKDIQLMFYTLLIFNITTKNIFAKMPVQKAKDFRAYSYNIMKPYIEQSALGNEILIVRNIENIISFPIKKAISNMQQKHHQNTIGGNQQVDEENNSQIQTNDCKQQMQNLKIEASQDQIQQKESVKQPIIKQQDLETSEIKNLKEQINEIEQELNDITTKNPQPNNKTKKKIAHVKEKLNELQTEMNKMKKQNEIDCKNTQKQKIKNAEFEDQIQQKESGKQPIIKQQTIETPETQELKDKIKSHTVKIQELEQKKQTELVLKRIVHLITEQKEWITELAKLTKYIKGEDQEMENMKQHNEIAFKNTMKQQNEIDFKNTQKIKNAEFKGQIQQIDIVKQKKVKQQTIETPEKQNLVKQVINQQKSQQTIETSEIKALIEKIENYTVKIKRFEQRTNQTESMQDAIAYLITERNKLITELARLTVDIEGEDQ